MAKSFCNENKNKLNQKSEYLKSLEKKSVLNKCLVEGMYSDQIFDEIFTKNE